MLTNNEDGRFELASRYVATLDHRQLADYVIKDMMEQFEKDNAVFNEYNHDYGQDEDNA